jgi:sigma-B regulation protein RsbU (phosphoserine phosphatase)
MTETSGHLLVVDDDDSNRNMLSRRLEREGFSVEIAADGPGALDAVGRAMFDLILLDIEMPGMSGFEVLRILRETHPATKLPVIIATARGDRKDIVEALGLGANDFVTKPLDFPVVLARVRTQLSHKQAVDRILMLESDLRARNLALEGANARMKRSLELAGRMQQSLLPVTPLRIPGFHFAWAYEPCDELGGDILNVFQLGNGQVGMYRLDVSGHGVPAALLSVTLSRMLQTVPGQASLVEQLGAVGLEPRSPRAVVEELNSRFQMSGTNLQYFTLFYGILDAKSRTLTYVSAGHPPGIFVPAKGPTRLLAHENFAVGWFENAQFEQWVLELEPSDRLFLYSDGCNETMNSVAQQFGSQRLAESFCRRTCDLQATIDGLQEQMKSFRGDTAAFDDVSVLAVEILGG